MIPQVPIERPDLGYGPPPGPAPTPPGRLRTLLTIVLVVVLGAGVFLVGALYLDTMNRPPPTPAAASFPSLPAAPTGGGSTIDRRPAQTTTTAEPPPLELLALQGRPPSPVPGDDGACAAALRPGGLSPNDWSRWELRPSPRTVPYSDAEARAEVELVMRRRFAAADPDQAVRDALSLYDSPAIRKMTAEDPVLRAALAELKGTLAEPALQFLLTTPMVVAITFGDPGVEGAGGSATTDGFYLDIVIADEYRLGRPALTAPLLLHEILHQNSQVLAARYEEMLNSVLQVRVGIEMVRDLPEIFDDRTKLESGLRWSVLAQLNTRVGSSMTLTGSDASTIFPETTSPAFPSFEAWFRGSDDWVLYAGLPDEGTSGHVTLRAVLTMMAPFGDVHPGADFDATTVAFVDANAGIASCDQLAAAVSIGTGGWDAATVAVRRYIAGLQP